MRPLLLLAAACVAASADAAAGCKVNDPDAPASATTAAPRCAPLREGALVSALCGQARLAHARTRQDLELAALCDYNSVRPCPAAILKYCCKSCKTTVSACSKTAPVLVGCAAAFGGTPKALGQLKALLAAASKGRGKGGSPGGRGGGRGRRLATKQVRPPAAPCTDCSCTCSSD